MLQELYVAALQSFYLFVGNATHIDNPAHVARKAFYFAPTERLSGHVGVCM